MRSQLALSRIFVTRFEDAQERFRWRAINPEEAGEQLGGSGQQAIHTRPAE